MKLENRGNDAINAVLSLLYTNDDFKKILYNPEVSLEKMKDDRYQVIHNLRKLFEFFDKTNYSCIYPKTLIGCINTAFPDFVSTQDHSLLYTGILDIVLGTRKAKELKEVNKEYISEHFIAASKKEKHLDFNGQYIKKFICSGCEEYHYSYDTFRTLELSNFYSGRSISEIINSNFERDFVNMECDECTTDADIEYSVDKFIFKLPDFLTIKINRMDSNGKCIDQRLSNITKNINIGNKTYSNSDEITNYVFESALCISENNGSYVIDASDIDNLLLIKDDLEEKITDFFTSDKHIVYIANYRKTK